MELEGGLTLGALFDQFDAAGGFTAKKLGTARSIMENMLDDDECTVFLSLPACVIATGMRGVVRDLVRHRAVDVIITTCGLLDHDLARVWQPYYHGNFAMDDSTLYDAGINRLGNVFVPNESYGIVLEQRMQPFLQSLWDEGVREIGMRELITRAGTLGDESSIVYWAAKNNIPIYVPGPTDGAFGSQLWMFTQTHRKFNINLFSDEQELSDIVFDATRTGALMLGGGISKHHTIWWNQFRDGLDYAVFITTAVEHDGSLSGARVREAVSWGKVRKTARYVTVEGDATILFPLLCGALWDHISARSDRT